MNAQIQFTSKINVDANQPAIYVDAKDREDGFVLSFGSFREQVAALRELGKIAQVIVPRDSDLEAANLQTGLKVRRNKLTSREKMARWVARQRAGLTYDPAKRDHYEGEAHEAFNKQLKRALGMSESALRKVIKEAKSACPEASAVEAKVSRAA